MTDRESFTGDHVTRSASVASVGGGGLASVGISEAGIFTTRGGSLGKN